MTLVWGERTNWAENKKGMNMGLVLSREYGTKHKEETEKQRKSCVWKMASVEGWEEGWLLHRVTGDYKFAGQRKLLSYVR